MKKSLDGLRKVSFFIFVVILNILELVTFKRFIQIKKKKKTINRKQFIRSARLFGAFMRDNSKFVSFYCHSRSALAWHKAYTLLPIPPEIPVNPGTLHLNVLIIYYAIVHATLRLASPREQNQPKDHSTTIGRFSLPLHPRGSLSLSELVLALYTFVS